MLRKKIQSDFNGNYTYFAYTITSDGIELLLENEDKVLPLLKVESKPINEDDLPF
jgi:hypothetical protein